MESGERKERMTAYIWDLDGTLLDSYGVIVEGAKKTAAEAGLRDSEAEVLRAVKQGSVTAYLNGVSERSGVPFRQLMARYRLHAHGLDDRITLTDGAKETLEKLRRSGAVHFVYTHRGSSSGPILERLGILDYFRDIVTSEHGFAAKPSGEGVRYLTDRYGLDPERTWYVGDRTLDVYCAKDAGVRALLYLAPDSCVSPTGQEDLIVHDLREIGDTDRQAHGQEEKKMNIRRMKEEDAKAVSDLIVTTIRISNVGDYTAELMEELVKTETPEHVLQRASWMHFYVAEEDGNIIGCGAIGPYWGKEDESSLFSIFVRPDYQGKGIGRAIVETLEQDEFALRARRIEIPASITGLPFYRKMGYDFKNGKAELDEEQLYRLEKFRN